MIISKEAILHDEKKSDISLATYEERNALGAGIKPTALAYARDAVFLLSIVTIIASIVTVIVTLT